MVEFTHILCPVDFSETSIRALTYATALATGTTRSSRSCTWCPGSRRAWRAGPPARQWCTEARGAQT